MPTPTTGSPTSDVPLTGDPAIDGLLIGAKWGGPVGTGVAVSFSFPDANSVWSTVQSDPYGYDRADPANDNPFAPGYRGLDAAQQASATYALAQWSHVADISFDLVTETPAEVGDIRVAFTDGGDIQGSYAYAYTPAPYAYAGDVWLNATQPVPSGNDFSIGANGYNTLIHELGHSIGLSHPFELPAFPAQFESFKYSVMSYSDFPGHQDTGDSSLYPTTPMLLDIQALQYIYGPNTSWNAGDDTYSFSEGGHYYETIWDAGGNDTFQYVSSGGGALIDLRAGHFSQLGAPIVLSDGSVQRDDVAIAFNVVIENAIGGSGDDTIVGNDAGNALDGGDGNDSLDGGAGNDTLDGGAGDDTLDGGAGNDTLDGGAGNDTADYSAATAPVIVDLNVGTASGNASVGTDTLIGINSVKGSAFADHFTDSAGDDTFFVGAGDMFDTATNGGTDTVISDITFTLASGLEKLTLAGVGAIDGTGSDADNQIAGNSGDNVLDGGYGNDMLSGGAGNDTLDGGAGNDTLNGGAGSDTYYVDSAGDSVIETSASGGTDRVYSAVSFALGANLERLTLTGSSAIDATGNARANVLTGNGEDNVLDGGAGNDTLEGGYGNDTYFVDSSGDSVLETSASGGTDRVFSSVSFTLGANLEDLTLTGSGAIDATGNALDNILTGNSGANVLDGGAGNDTLIGGAGNDTYAIDASDTVVESTGAGMDTVRAGFSYALGPNLENLTLTGTGNFNATGNAADNALTGNAGDNILNGGAGNDTLIGGAGNDTYYVVDSGDVVVETGGGNDTVVSARDMSLGSSAAGIENLTLLAGSAALAATGNAQDNLLRGNGHDNTLVGLAGNDTLIGGNGNDTMLGGAGNDDYRVDRAGDVVTESAGAGSDTVHSRVNCALSANVEDLVLTGNALTGSGNALNNVLTGDARDNLLEGGAGNDTLEGGAGVDLLAGGAGNDTYLVDRTADDIVELAGGGIDTVHSSAGYFQLDAWVENLVLDAGAGNAQGVGNNGNNVLTGNDGNDTLDGREGNDTLTGGAGADTFVFDTAPAANLDTIADYSVTEDTLRLDSAIFASLGAEGALSPGMLHAGAGASTAADANDFLIYDSTTGALYYDADGSGGASAPVEFALLAGAPALTSADFVVG